MNYFNHKKSFQIIIHCIFTHSQVTSLQNTARSIEQCQLLTPYSSLEPCSHGVLPQIQALWIPTITHNSAAMHLVTKTE